MDGNNQYRPMVVYNPAAEYRLIDMHSSMNLNRIDIIVYWKDTFGNIHPFELHPGCATNVKLLFRRKTLIPLVRILSFRIYIQCQRLSRRF